MKNRVGWVGYKHANRQIDKRKQQHMGHIEMGV